MKQQEQSNIYGVEMFQIFLVCVKKGFKHKQTEQDVSRLYCK